MADYLLQIKKDLEDGKPITIEDFGLIIFLNDVKNGLEYEDEYEDEENDKEEEA